MNPPAPGPTPSKPRLLPLFAFTLAYMILSIATAIHAGNREFIFYIVVMLVLIGAVSLLHWRMNLTGKLLWALSVWGLLHMAGGLVPIPSWLPSDGEHSVLYSLWLIPHRLKFDQVVHAYGFGVTTMVCWHVLHHGLRDLTGSRPKPTFGLLILCIAAGMGFGAFNEIVEFIATLTMPSTNVGGYENTGWDLVSNLLGSILAAFLIRMGR